MRFFLRVFVLLFGVALIMMTAVVGVARLEDSVGPSWLVYMEQESAGTTIYRLDPENRKRYPLIQSDSTYKSLMRSHDGRWFYYVHTFDIRKIHITGCCRQIVTDDRAFRKDSFAVSPDGEWIAFITNQDATNLSHIFRVRSDGTELQRLTKREGAYTDLAWSPDGTWILLVASEVGNSRIYRVRSDGSHVQYLTAGSAPMWSPDGTRIVFQNLASSFHLYCMNANGSNVRKLVEGHFPTWSPDANWIVFRVLEKNGLWYLYRIRPDGSDLQQLARGYYPIWSPDGDWLAVMDKWQHETNIYRMRLDGSDVQQLTASSSGKSSPIWTPPVNLPFRAAIPLAVGVVCSVGSLWLPYRRSHRRNAIF